MSTPSPFPRERRGGFRRALLTREGWYYVFVLAFIVGGAVLRQVNLLVLLSGLMIAPLLFNWRMAAAAVRRCDVRRRLPRRISAGDPLTVELEARNADARYAVWALRLHDEIREEGAAAGPPARVAALLPSVPAGGAARASYQAVLTRRGKYRFGPLRLATRHPLGLVECRLDLDRPEALLVCPRRGRLAPQWRRILDAPRPGDERAPRRRGLMEGDYYALRDYRPGDARRWIHWRTTARLGRPAVKQFEQRLKRDVVLVLDPWLPAAAGDAERERLELAICVAATLLAEFCRQGGVRLALAVAGEPGVSRTAAAASGFLGETLERLALVRGSSDSDWAQALGAVRAGAASGAWCAVVSTRAEAAAPSGAAPPAAEAARPPTWIDVSDGQLGSWFQLEEAAG